jgi:hypothetical protein
VSEITFKGVPVSFETDPDPIYMVTPELLQACINKLPGSQQLLEKFVIFVSSEAMAERMRNRFPGVRVQLYPFTH